MKKFTFLINIIALFVMLSNNLFAETAVETKGAPVPESSRLMESIDMTISSEIWSQYAVDSAVYHNSPVLWTDLTWNLDGGMYINIWWSAGLDDSDLSSNFGDEVDYTIGRVIPVGENLLLNTGISYFDILEVGTFENDIVSFYAELTTSILLVDNTMLSPFTKIKVNRDTGSSGLDNVYSYIGVRGHLDKGRLTANSEVVLIHDAGDMIGFNSGVIGELLYEINYRVSDNTSLTLAQFKVMTPITDVDDGRQTEFIYGAGFTVHF